MLTFKQVTKRYPSGKEALKQMTFHLKRGEMAFLTGHSGAGKTSVLKLSALIERPTQGQIIVNGYHLNTLSNRHIPSLRRFMGIVFQDPKLLYDRTVFNNVALPLVIAEFNHHDIARRTRAALDKVNLLNKEKLYPKALSSGEQQRVGIARAIVNKPALLLADEPTGNLDPELSQEIMNLFTQFNQVGVTVLIASHDLALIASMNYRLLTLKDGALI